jgi:hypothetical protein
VLGSERRALLHCGRGEDEGSAVVLGFVVVKEEMGESNTDLRREGFGVMPPLGFGVDGATQSLGEGAA